MAEVDVKKILKELHEEDARQARRDYQRAWRAKRKASGLPERNVEGRAAYNKAYKDKHRQCPRFRLQRLVHAARKRAKGKGVEFGLDWQRIEIPEACPLLGIPLSFGGGYAERDSSPSLDRIDPNRGYTHDNVWIISNRANTIKNNATLSELKMLVRNLSRKVSEVSG